MAGNAVLSVPAARRDSAPGGDALGWPVLGPELFIARQSVINTHISPALE